MIDIEKLRRLALGGNFYAIHELVDHLEAAEKERTIDEQRIADLMAELNRVGQENEEMHARIEAIERQEPTRDWWDALIADVSSIDCMYRGSPTYAHDAYWMRDRVEWILKQRRDHNPGAKEGEEK